MDEDEPLPPKSSGHFWSIGVLKVLVPVAVIVFSTFLYVPYLAREGARDFPQFNLRFETVAASMIFSGLSLFPFSVGILISNTLKEKRLRNWIIISSLTFVGALSAIGVIFLQLPFSLGLFGWFVACAGAGDFLFTLERAKQSYVSATWQYSVDGTVFIVVLFLIAVAGVNFSGSLFLHLPLGGPPRPRIVRFVPQGRVPLKIADGISESVILYYEDDRDYWFKKLNDDQDAYEMTHMPKSLLGPTEEGGHLAPLNLRPRRWLINAVRVEPRN